MAIDTHIKFDGVEGESQHESHKGEVEVLAWSWGVTNASQIGGGGSGKGKAQPGDFTFTHMFDKASPVLAKKCAQGLHFPTVTLTSRKSGEGQKDFLVVTMKEVFITGAHPAASSDGGIVENISLSYGDITFDYKPQDEKGGLGGSVKWEWNVKTTAIT